MRLSKLLIPAVAGLVVLGDASAQQAGRASVYEGTLTPITGHEQLMQVARRELGITGGENRFANVPLAPNKIGSTPFAAAPGDVVFTTLYDLQSNGSMPNRVINWPDDESDIASSMIWMASTDGGPNYPSRGTHQAVQENGQDWSYLGKIEDANVRTGFPCLGRLSLGNLVIVNHNSDGGINFLREEGFGSTSFLMTNVPNSGPVTPGGSDGGLWPRLAVGQKAGGGDVVHVIWTYQNRTPNDGILMYSRFDNESETWSDTVSLTAPSSPVAGETRARAVTGGDSYAIAAAGDQVVIVYQSGSITLNMLRSTDGGATWQSYTVDSPYRQNNGYQRRYYNQAAGDSAMYRLNPNPDEDTIAYRYHTDTTYANGNSLDVIIDEQGEVRVISSLISTYTIYLQKPSEDTTGIRGTIYETDDIDVTAPGLEYYVIGSDNRYTVSFIPQVGGLDGTEYFLNDRAYQSRYSRWPQLGVDDLGDVFLVYASGVKGDVKMATPLKGPHAGVSTPFLYSHVYATWTNDGAQWSQPMNLTPNGLDAQFPSLADLVDGELQIAYQADDYPGDYVTDADTSRPQVHPANTNEVAVMKIATSSLPAPGTTGVDETGTDRTAGSAAIVSAAPNPTTGATRVTYRVASTGQVTLSLYDVMGRRVLSPISDATVAAGEYVWSFDASNLPAGAYYATITTGGTTSTRVLTVTH